MDRQAQINIVSIIGIFVMIVAYWAMLPVINDIITDILPELGEIEKTLMQMIPFFILLAIIASIFTYTRPEW